VTPRLARDRAPAAHQQPLRFTIGGRRDLGAAELAGAEVAQYVLLDPSRMGGAEVGFSNAPSDRRRQFRDGA
jgi:hypothetical protein